MNKLSIKSVEIFISNYLLETCTINKLLIVNKFIWYIYRTIKIVLINLLYYTCTIQVDLAFRQSSNFICLLRYNIQQSTNYKNFNYSIIF